MNVIGCGSPHATEFVAILTLPDGPFPAQSTIDDYQKKCADALDAYSPTSSEDSSVQLTTLAPLSGDWSDGDHTIDCVASLSPPGTSGDDPSAGSTWRRDTTIVTGA